jgi:hypothetical protein
VNRLIDDVKSAIDDDWWGYLDDYESLDGVETISDKILDQTRWGVIKELIARRGDEYVKLTWEQAAAEGEYCNQPEIQEVKPVEKTVIVYEPV